MRPYSFVVPALALLLPLVARGEQWLSYDGHGVHVKHHIVLVSGDQEYRSEEALPQLARILSKTHGFSTTVLFTQHANSPGIVNPVPPVEIPGLDRLAGADLMIIFTRFLALPDEQMTLIDDFLKRGKAVIGIRTATHAFAFQRSAPNSPWRHYGNEYEGDELGAWRGGFGRLVLGEKWIAHHGEHKHQSTRGILAPEARAQRITNGIADGEIWGPSDVYRVRLPLPGDSVPILLGRSIDRAGPYDARDLLFGMRQTDVTAALTDAAGVELNDPLMPIAWIKSYQIPGGQQGRAFTSTIGSSTDMQSEALRRLWVNAVYWSLNLEVPERADVAIRGEFSPTQFGFHEPTYWMERQMKIADLR